ncbi:hypothetical protein [Achromobacter insuavis]|uniref:hypothetical protein n=1 Tax=Achromobacter insuavis TaxID=1287735 RepID=UPI001F12CE59|nr:hypothetical protein [Achromobacter insuavis]
MLFKAVLGGFLALAGADSPDNLERLPVRVIFAEECAASFGICRLSVRASSPTVQDESRTEKSYLCQLYRDLINRSGWCSGLAGWHIPTG